VKNTVYKAPLCVIFTGPPLLLSWVQIFSLEPYSEMTSDYEKVKVQKSNVPVFN